MLYYLVHDTEDGLYTILYKRSPTSGFLFNRGIELRWGPIEHAFSKLELNPTNLDTTSTRGYSIILEFTPQSHPEFFI